jgi:hypothetical protein
MCTGSLGGGRRLARKRASSDPDYPETGFEEINRDFREADFWPGIHSALPPTV